MKSTCYIGEVTCKSRIFVFSNKTALFRPTTVGGSWKIRDKAHLKLINSTSSLFYWTTEKRSNLGPLVLQLLLLDINLLCHDKVHLYQEVLLRVISNSVTRLAADPCTLAVASKANLFFTALVFRPAIVGIDIVSTTAATEKTSTVWSEANLYRTLTPLVVLRAQAKSLL